jgi:hypothetical protein
MRHAEFPHGMKRTQRDILICAWTLLSMSGCKRSILTESLSTQPALTFFFEFPTQRLKLAHRLRSDQPSVAQIPGRLQDLSQNPALLKHRSHLPIVINYVAPYGRL